MTLDDLTRRLAEALETAAGQYGAVTDEQRNEWMRLVQKANEQAGARRDTVSGGAANTFETVQRYLTANGWYQDGDDPGLWLPDKVTVGTAFETQLERDGFRP